jgi:heat shock protein HslJ
MNQKESFRMNRNQTIILRALLLLLALALVGCSLVPAADPLDGTSWVLVSYDKNQPIEDTTLTAEFSDGKVGGSSGCNTYGGSYEVSGEKLTVDEVAWTLMACFPEGVMEQEQRFMELLTNAQTFTVSTDRLEITASDGRSMLVFEPLGN